MLPSNIVVSYWNGTAWVPVTGRQTQFATASNQPTTITFDPVSTTGLRRDLTSPAPGANTITELQVPANEVSDNTTWRWAAEPAGSVTVPTAAYHP